MYEAPHNFLGLDDVHSAFETSQVLILPIPFEATVSYGHGTAYGPEAIINASQQVELYDREFDEEPALNWGVHTLEPLDIGDDAPEIVMPLIAEAVQQYAESGKLLCVLGGEHSISGAIAEGLQAVYGDFVTVQIDAHADLRDEYEGSAFSHACAMRRLLDAGSQSLLQLGIRSLCLEEADMIKHDARVTTFFSEDVHAGKHRQALADFVRGKQVYLTIDVDGLDISLIPATGTPEPDGLTWNEVLEIIHTVAREAAQVIAFDVMELAPIEGLHAADFVAAKLTYKTMSIIQSRQ